jgi:outer membrane lipoprotein carrier protein
MRATISRLLLLAVFVLSIGQTAAAQDADAVFQRLRDKYQTIQSLRAEFTQTMTSAYTDGESSFAGQLVLEGDKYRVETGSEVLIVTDTETYVYRPNEKQVLINDVVEDDNSFSPSDFLLNYDERFDVSSVETVTIGGTRHYKLRLTPKKADSFFQEATLWVRNSDTIITRVEVLDVNDTKMVFSLKNIQLNPRIDAKTFSFTPPQGVEVIDLRS